MSGCDDFRGRLQVTQLYRERIPDNAVVLDLMSSWVSHLPSEKKYQRVIGHGMNAAEVTRQHSSCSAADCSGMQTATPPEYRIIT